MKGTERWLSIDEIRFLDSLDDRAFMRLYPLLRTREWGDMDKDKIMKVADNRYSALLRKRMQ